MGSVDLNGKNPGTVLIVYTHFYDTSARGPSYTSLRYLKTKGGPEK